MFSFRPYFFFSILFLSSPVWAIDCNKASTATEKTICAHDDLQILDKVLNKNYHAHYITSELKKQQKKWLQQRDRCKDKTCLVEAYIKRIKALSEKENITLFPNISEKWAFMLSVRSYYDEEGWRNEKYYGTLYIFDKTNNRLVQTIGYEDPAFLAKDNDSLRIDDYNFDNHNDLAILTHEHLNRDSYYNIFLYDPQQRQFVLSEAISDLGYSPYTGTFDVDKTKQTITTDNYEGPYRHYVATYRIKQNKPVLIKQISEISYADENHNILCTDTIEEFGYPDPEEVLVATEILSSTLAYSVNCENPDNDKEQLVCDTPELAQLNTELNKKLVQFGHLNVVRLQQSIWLNERFNKCEMISCFKEAFEQRLANFNPQHEQPYVSIDSSRHAFKENQKYTVTLDAPWFRGTLIKLPPDDYTILDVTVIDNTIHAFLMAPRYNCDEIRNEDGGDFSYRILEYVDSKESLFVIESNEKIVKNTDDKRYSGIEGGFFYYSIRTEQGSFIWTQPMQYYLGSQQRPELTEGYTIKQHIENNARGHVVIDDGMDISYELTDSEGVRSDINPTETILSANYMNGQKIWNIDHVIWHPTKPVFYFDNVSDMACIWRVDVVNKTVDKIVPEHEAFDPFPISLNGREAVVYIEGFELKIAYPN